MKRREFIALLTGAAVSCRVGTAAQSQERVRRIGALAPNTADNPLTLQGLSIFLSELQRLGWIGRKNIQIEYRFGNNDPLGRLPMMARELVELQPEVIVTATASSVIALMRATQSIPIVFVAVGDPLGTGIVSNLARPGGNVTGFAATAPQAS
jgi:putative ABC transport system substrate-binding protein